MHLRQQLGHASLLLYICVYVYIKNNEPWNWSVTANMEVFPRKVNTKFCNCLRSNFERPIFEFFEQFEANMKVLEIYFLVLENDKKNWI